MNTEKNYIVDTLFVLGLFLAFAVCGLILTGMGSDIYEKCVRDMNDHYLERTTTSYITEKVRHSDKQTDSPAIELSKFGDGDCILIHEEGYEEPYVTCLYVWKNKLKELAVLESDLPTYSPDAGTDIIDINKLSVEKENDNLLKVIFNSSSNSEMNFYIGVKSGIR